MTDYGLGWPSMALNAQWCLSCEFVVPVYESITQWGQISGMSQPARGCGGLSSKRNSREEFVACVSEFEESQDVGTCCAHAPEFERSQNVRIVAELNGFGPQRLI